MRTILFFLLAAPVFSAPPLLVFSTYHGGDRNDQATAVAVDAAGHTFVAGLTESRNFPATPVGPAANISATTNAYLTKLSPNGNEVVWSLLIGGASQTRINAAATDGSGNVYVTGRTGSRNFPLLNAVQSTQPGLNIAFLMKFDATGKLLFSTLLGGERNDEPNAIGLDSQGNIYIAGRTNSTTFPTKNALHGTAPGGGDAFIAKFTPDYQLAYATYFGGTGADEIFSLAIGPDDSLYVAGDTYSPDLPTEGGWLPRLLGTSGFVARIASGGDAVLGCTYVGGRGGYTRAQAITVDPAGNAYVTGYTSVKEFPVTKEALQSSYAGGLRDAFLVKLNDTLSTALYATYLGGSYAGTSDPDETAAVVKVDHHGHVWVGGETSSPDFPTYRALQDQLRGERDGYIVRLDLEQHTIVSSTFWGGDKADQILALTLGPGENVTVSGITGSADLRLQNPIRTAVGSYEDAFATRICAPWLIAAPGELVFHHTAGQAVAAPQQVRVESGCWVAHEVTEVVVSEGWLRVTPDRSPMDATLTLTVNPEGLAAGEYAATVLVTVPEAVNGPLRIPVTLMVSESADSEGEKPESTEL